MKQEQAENQFAKNRVSELKENQLKEIVKILFFRIFFNVKNIFTLASKTVTLQRTISQGSSRR